MLILTVSVTRDRMAHFDRGVRMYALLVPLDVLTRRRRVRF